MSASSLGIPIPFGIVHGIKKDNTYSLFGNAMPPLCVLQYSKPKTLNSKTELEELDLSTLVPGEGFYVKDLYPDNKSPEHKGLQPCQFMYDNKDNALIELNNPNVKDYLNIYALYPGENLADVEFFMRLHIKNIQSNIKIISMLDSNFALYNNELYTFLGLNGNYNLDNSFSNNVISNLLYVNIKNGMYVLMRRLCSIYDVEFNQEEYDYKQLFNSIIQSLDRVISDTNFEFIQLVNESVNIDLSMYINYISACFACFRYVLVNKYSNDTIDVAINPLLSLPIVDTTLVDKLNINSTVSNSFENILSVANDILYAEKSSAEFLKYNFYPKLKELVSYFMEKNNKIATIISTRNSFFEDLCEGIGGIVNLALFFSIISNADITARTSIFFHFITPKKFDMFY